MNVNRRGFLKVGAGAAGGLLVSFYLPESSKLAADTAGAAKLNTFIHIAPDDSITFTITKSEMGQGTLTSLTQILAEHLDCDWKNIKTEIPSPEPSYGMMGTYGSLSVRTTYNTLLTAGETARGMLVQAAAQKWGVDPKQCRTESGAVLHNVTNERLTYGSLADAASKINGQTNPVLRSPAQFKIIGKSIKRRDTPDKVSGRAMFGIDAKVDGMLYAVVARCPVFGGKVASFDATKAKAVPGVKQVVEISRGVAVLGDNTWAAIEGRKALVVQWNEGPLATTSSATIRKTFAELAEKPGAVARKEGDVTAALSHATKKIDAVYEVPYLSHAPMEPLNAVAHVRADG